MRRIKKTEEVEIYVGTYREIKSFEKTIMWGDYTRMYYNRFTLDRNDCSKCIMCIYATGYYSIEKQRMI